MDAILDTVLGQIGEVGTKSIGFYAVDTDGEVLIVDCLNELGAGHIEDLVTALEAKEVIQARIDRLDHGSHRSVGHDYPRCQGMSKLLRAGQGSGHHG
jgi:hypothetical protein